MFAFARQDGSLSSVLRPLLVWQFGGVAGKEERRILVLSSFTFAITRLLCPVGRRQGYCCNHGTRGLLVEAHLEGDRAITAIWEPEIFCWQAQLEGDRATTAIWELEIIWWQAQLEGDKATTAIWELEIFWWQAQLEGDRATTAIWELEIFWWQATGLQVQPGYSRFFGGRPSWKAAGHQLQSGNSRFFGGRPSCKCQGFLPFLRE